MKATYRLLSRRGLSNCCLMVAALAGARYMPYARATIINFDDVVPSVNTAVIIPSNHYAAQGVTIQTILNATDGLTLGSVFTAALFQDSFLIGNTAAAFSPPSFALANRVAGGVVAFGVMKCCSRLTP